MLRTIIFDYFHTMYPSVVTAEWLLDNLYNSNLQIFDVSFFEGLPVE